MSTSTLAEQPQARAWWRPQWAIPILALLGVLDSSYLTWVKVVHAKPFCAGLGECERVNTSVYSEFMGIPIALLGIGMYGLLFALAVWGPRLPGALALYAPLAIFAISLGGVLYSAYLTWLELYVIEAICPYCVVSAILITLIFVVSLRQLLKGEPATAEA